MTLTRVPNWSVKLAGFADSVLGKPFVWGETDCVSICRGALETMYGEDIIAPHFDGTYSTKTGAARAFSKVGSLSAIAEQAGAKEVRHNMSVDGDVMVFPKVGPYENVATRIGGMWIISDQDLDRVIATRILPTSINPNVKVFRF